MKRPWLLVTLFLSINVPDLCRSQEEQFAGPYNAVLYRIDKCDDAGTNRIYVSSTRINKISRTKYVFSTNVTAEFTFGDELTAELDIAKFGNGGWKPHYMQMEFPQFCTSMTKLAPVFFNAVLEALNTQCPIHSGIYILNDLDLDKFKIGPLLPNFPYGKYRTDFKGFVNNTLVGCIRYFVDVVPNKTSRRKYKPQ